MQYKSLPSNRHEEMLSSHSSAQPQDHTLHKKNKKYKIKWISYLLLRKKFHHNIFPQLVDYLLQLFFSYTFQHCHWTLYFYTHLDPKNFHPSKKGTRSHTLFFFKSNISSYMATFQDSTLFILMYRPL